MRLVYWIASLLLVGALMLHSAPYVARDVIVYSLIERGADSAKLKRVRIDWFNAKLELQGLDLSYQGRSALSGERLSFDIYLQELLDNRLRLSGLRLEGISAQLTQQDQLLLLGPIVLLGGESQVQKLEESESSYEFGSDLIELVDVDIELLQPNASQKLNIERLNIGGLYQWSPLEATDLRFVGHLNGAPITIDSSALPLPERKTLSVQLALRQLELTPLVATFSPGLAATVDLNLNVELALEGYQAWISQSGSVQLSEVSLALDESRAELGSLSWQGESSQLLNLQEGAEPLIELALNGLLGADQIELLQGDLAARLSTFSLKTDLSVTPETLTMQGSTSLALVELGLSQPGQNLELGALDVNIPDLSSGPQTSVDLSATDLRATRSSAETLSLARLNADLVLGQQSGQPIWQPVSVAGDISLNQLDASAEGIEVALQQLQAKLSSSSLSEVEKLAVDAGFEGMTALQADTRMILGSGNVALNYDVATELFELRSELGQSELWLADQQLKSDSIRSTVNGSLPLDFSQFSGEVGLQSEQMSFTAPETAHSLAALNLTSRLTTLFPTEKNPASIELLESLVLNAQLQGAAFDSPEIAGQIEAVALEAGLASRTGAVKVDLIIDRADLNTPEVSAKAVAYRAALEGVFGKQWQRFVGALELQSKGAALKASELDARWEALSFAGPVKLQLTSDILSLPLTLRGDLGLKQLQLRAAETDLSLAGLAGSLKLNQQEALSLAGSLRIDQMNLDQNGQRARFNRAQLRPNLNFNHSLAQLDPLAVEGGVLLSLNELGANFGGQNLGLTRLTSDLQLQSGGNRQTLKGSLSARALSYQADQQSLELAEFSAQPEIARDSAGMTIDTPISLSGLAYRDTDQSANLDELNGSVSTRLNPDLSFFSAELSALSLTGLMAEFDEILRLEQAQLAKLTVEQPLHAQLQAQLQALELRQFSLGPQEANLVSLSSLNLDRATFGDDLLDLGVLVTENLQANLQSELNSQTVKSESDPSQTNATGPSADPAQDRHLPIDIRLQSFDARGQTLLNYRDSSLAAPLNLNLVASKLSAGSWDSRARKPLAINLRAKLNESADISLDASFTPLKAKPDGQWNAQIQSLQMPTLSPLVQTFAGYQIRAGALSLDANGTLEAGQLNGSNAVRIQRLEVQRGAESAADETDKLFTMPLPSAVSLLEKEERLIELDLPVSGDINDPKFNYQDIIQIVVTKGVKEGATLYLTNALQPFGAIYMLYNTVKDVNEKGRFIQLQPLEFDPAIAELNRAGRDYAAKLGGMMQERPGLTLEICPITLVSEEQLLWDELVKAQEGVEKALTGKALGDEWKQRIAALAAARIEALRSSLIRLGVANERIFPCIARSGTTEGAPRVELAF